MNDGFDWAQAEYDRQEPHEPEPVGQCSICGKDIFAGEQVCMVDDEMICSECFEITTAEEEEPINEC